VPVKPDAGESNGKTSPQRRKGAKGRKETMKKMPWKHARPYDMGLANWQESKMPMPVYLSKLI